MKLDLIKSKNGRLTDYLKDSLKWATEAKFGVAYGTYAAFSRIKSDVENFLRRDGKLRTIFDIEEFITDKKIIEELSTIPGDSECKIYCRPKKLVKEFPHKFHPKLYLFKKEDKYRVIVGSANFTLGGLGENIETSICITDTNDELFNQFENYFEELWNLECVFNILQDSEILSDYENLFQKFKNRIKRNPKYKKQKEKLNKHASRLYELSKRGLNEDFAYLLGLISANCLIDFETKEIIIDLYRQVVNKGKDFEGKYYYPEVSNYSITQAKAHQKDLDRISEKLSELIRKKRSDDTIERITKSDLHYQIKISFVSSSSIWRDITSFNIELDDNKVIPFVPDKILETEDRKIILAFLGGYCDLKSRLSPSDGIYKIDKKTNKKIFSSLRMGISFPHGDAEILEKFKTLFNKIGIDKGMSVTNPKKRTRENLIRIDVRYLPYELFGTHWKRIFLRDFQYFMNNDMKYEPTKVSAKRKSS